jgi:hypothetical protein
MNKAQAGRKIRSLKDSLAGWFAEARRSTG